MVENKFNQKTPMFPSNEAVFITKNQDYLFRVSTSRQESTQSLKSQRPPCPVAKEPSLINLLVTFNLC